MSVRMRMTRAKTHSRRAHHRVKKPAVAFDKKTGHPHLRHFMDPATGTYRGNAVIPEAATSAPSSKAKESAETEAAGEEKPSS